MLTAEVDYLIVGAGARGMAFADEIIHHDPEATVVLVDRRTAPGGHWVDAYPYVRLHQPALFYGVGSAALGSGGHDLASKAEILAYYVRVMETLQATGRCHFLLGHDYQGDGQIRSLSDPERILQIQARRLVDSVYIAVSIPATRPPPFPVDPSLTIVPPNALAQREQKWERHVVIGAGKTGMDAVLCLLGQGVEPAAIRWIVSQDAWLFNRDQIWPEVITRSFGPQARAIHGAADWRDVYHRLEAIGLMLRVRPDLEPTAFRCATVSREEVEQLRRIEDVVRMGRVQRIEADTIVLDRGVVSTGPAVLHVDCTADGLPVRSTRPIFEEGRITLQSIMICQPAMSAAMIARVERTVPDDATRNRCLQPISPPAVPADLFHCMVLVYDNAHRWLVRRHLRRFIFKHRLSMVSHFSLWRTVITILMTLRWGLLVERKIRALAATLTPRELPDAGEPAP